MFERLYSPRRIGIPARPSTAAPSSWPRAKRVYSGEANEHCCIPTTSVLLDRGLGAFLDKDWDDEETAARRRSTGTTHAAALLGTRPGSGGGAAPRRLMQLRTPPAVAAAALPSRRHGGDAPSLEASCSSSIASFSSSHRPAPLQSPHLHNLRPERSGGLGTFEAFAALAAEAAQGRAQRGDRLDAALAAVSPGSMSSLGPTPTASGDSPPGRRAADKAAGGRPPWSPAASGGARPSPASASAYLALRAGGGGAGGSTDAVDPTEEGEESDHTRFELLREQSEKSGVGLRGGLRSGEPSQWSLGRTWAAEQAEGQPQFLRTPPFYRV